MAESVSEKVIRLETQMINNSSQLATIEAKVDSLIVKVDQFTTLQFEIQQLKAEIAVLKKHKVLYGWLFPTLSAVAGAILTLLIASAIRK